MRTTAIAFLSVFTAILAASCTVISQPIRSDSEPQVPFSVLLRDAEKYTGRTVILGGYMLETNNLASETVLKVLQVPLRMGEEPAPKDRSEGRFIVYHNRTLPPYYWPHPYPYPYPYLYPHPYIYPFPYYYRYRR
jgi:starvation-inducible outer membrane lipoprotein